MRTVESLRGKRVSGGSPKEASREGHVLAVDVGTSAVRVSAVGREGTVLAAAAGPGPSTVAGDAAVLDVDELWRDLAELIREVVDASGQPGAVGVAAQLGTVFADEQLAATGPALLWQDRRATGEAAELTAVLGADAVRLAGRRSSADLAAPRLLWLARNHPAQRARTRFVLTLKDLIVARLTGAVATDPVSASYTLLYDVSKGEWSERLGAAAGVEPGLLPQVLPAAARAGAVLAEPGEQTGLQAGIPVAVGGPDGSVGALGSGAAAPGITVDVSGTTDVLLAVVDRPVTDPLGRTVLNAFLEPGLWTVGGPTGMTGGAVRWLAGLLGYESVEDAYLALGEDAAALAPGAGGVSFHTALTGERFPTWASEQTGAVGGLEPGHGPAHLLRAAEEGAAFTVRQGLEALTELGVEVGGIRISGGTSKRREGMEMRANAWGRPVVGVSTPEATTTGAAILAATCCGLHEELAAATSAMVRLEPAIDPDASAVAAYDGAYLRWQASRPAAGEQVVR